MSEQQETIARIIAPDQWRAREGDIAHGEEWHRKADRYAIEADPNLFPLGQQAIDRTVEAWHGLADRFITGAGDRVKDSLAKADLILATTPTPAADIVIPTDIAEHVLSLGRVEWGQTPAHDAEGHGAHVVNSVRLTAEHFEQTGDQHMHGLWLAGTETVLCHTGTSPNAPKTTQALVGVWNWLVDQALATTPARNTSQIGEG